MRSFKIAFAFIGKVCLSSNPTITPSEVFTGHSRKERMDRLCAEVSGVYAQAIEQTSSLDIIEMFTEEEFSEFEKRVNQKIASVRSEIESVYIAPRDFPLQEAPTARLPRGVERDSMDKLWFREISEFWEGQAMSLLVDEIIYSGHTGMQEVLVFKHARYGTVLVLDGAIQVTTLDESAYQEMMAHTPMHLQIDNSVKRVLVIGGGDGGVLRELAKYSEIEEIHICEIDEGVINIAKRFIPETAVGFSDPRVTVHIEDGFVFLERMIGQGITYDVIVSDLSDPVGPAESIFRGSFIELLSRVLNPVSGVAALQGESFWLHSELIKELISNAKNFFPTVRYASIGIPTYPCGQIGSLIMTKSPTTDLHNVIREGGVDYSRLSFYTRELHAAQFVLPKIAYKNLT